MLEEERNGILLDYWMPKILPFIAEGFEVFNKEVTYFSYGCAQYSELWQSDCSPKAEIASDGLLGAVLLGE